MMPLLLGLYGHGFADGGGLGAGLGALGSTVAHAVLWSMVARFMWHAPIALFVAAGVAAAVFVVAFQRRRR